MSAPAGARPQPFALGALDTDQHALAVQLQIVRLRSELEVVEGRMHEARAAVAAQEGALPYAGRAEQLLAEIVESLDSAAHNELLAASAATRTAAEALVEEGRRQARAILTEARDEVNEVFARRADVIVEPPVSTADNSVDAVTLEGSPTLGGSSQVADLHHLDELHHLGEPLLDLDFFTPVEAHEVDSPPKARPVVPAPSPVAAAVPAVDLDPGRVPSPSPVAGAAADCGDTIVLDDVAEVDELDDLDGELLDFLVGPTIARSDVVPPVAEPAPLPTDGPGRFEVDDPDPLPQMAASDVVGLGALEKIPAMAAEAARTDAAFEAWMAVAPCPPGAESAPDPPAEPILFPTSDRSMSWVHPVEVLGSLAAVAVLVVLLLVFVG